MDPTTTTTTAARPRHPIATTRRLVGLVAVVAALLGWLTGMDRARRSVLRAGARFTAEIDDLHRREPSLAPVGRAVRVGWTWDGCALDSREVVKAPDGRLMTIALEARSTVFGATDRLTVESGGRAVTRPFDPRPGSGPIDPRPDFPGAFRPRPIVRPPGEPGKPPGPGDGEPRKDRGGP